MTNLHPIQIAKRLVAADGYLELGLPVAALRALEGIEDAGQFEAAAQFLRGRAFCAQAQFQQAADSFAAAARLLPSPFNRHLWIQMSECYRRAGWTTQAVNTLACARGAKLEPEAGQPHKDPESI